MDQSQGSTRQQRQLGRHYYFIVDMCTTLGHPHLADCPADPEFVLAVNCGGGVWIPGLLAILDRRRNPMVGACALGIPLVNAIAHIARAVVHGAYNAGLATAVILFVPLCAFALIQLRRAGVLAGRRIFVVFAMDPAERARCCGGWSSGCSRRELIGC